jgi:putative sterol carrier protein
MPSRFQEMLKTQRLNSETSRAGLKWESDEDDKLLTMVSNNVSPVEIAKSLQRTEGSIKTRLIVYALGKMDKENLSLEQVAQLVKLDGKDITDYQERQAIREERKQKRTNLPKRPTNVTNADLYDLLQFLDRKLDNLLHR